MIERIVFIVITRLVSLDIIGTNKFITCYMRYQMPQDFLNQFSSKADLINYLKEQQQVYLPPATMITHDWVKLVFAGEKRWLKAADVVHANPPR